MKKKFKTENEIWDQLEKDLKCKIDACIRGYYEWRGYISGVLDGEDSYEGLKEDAQKLLKCVKDLRKPPQATSHLPNTHEIVGDRRAQTISKVWAVELNELPIVREFRDNYMEGRTLEGPDEVDEWLDIQAYGEVQDYLDKQTDVIAAEWHLGMFDLTFQYHDPRLRIYFAEKGSVLDELRKLADEIHSSTPWSKGQATWFILTGKPPQMKMLSSTVSYRSNNGEPVNEIIMHILPRTSPTDVLNVYREVRGSLLIPQRDRDISEKNARLLDFVITRKDQYWKSIHKEWNETYPSDKVDQLSNFKRNYKRAYQKLTQPDTHSLFTPNVKA